MMFLIRRARSSKWWKWRTGQLSLTRMTTKNKEMASLQKTPRLNQIKQEKTPPKKTLAMK
jgi:hypothetical protein